jgi:CheY-like chemotaxis protein
VFIKLSQNDGPLARTYETLVRLQGFDVVRSAREADVVVTDRVEISQAMLADGHRVIHLCGERRLGFEPASESLKAHPEYGPRYSCIDPLSVLSLFVELAKYKFSPDETTSVTSTGPDFASILGKSTMKGLRMLVVDNQELNRASATFQFAESNTLSVCDTYKEAADLLRTKQFDVVLLDLLMPPESFTLSDKAFERVVGSEFPAGIFIALVAARAGVKDIRIVTDASHHDHPATALIDFIPWGSALSCGSDSHITFEKARTVQIPGSTDRVNDSVKDWASTLEGRTLFGRDRPAPAQGE